MKMWSEFSAKGCWLRFLLPECFFFKAFGFWFGGMQDGDCGNIAIELWFLSK